MEALDKEGMANIMGGGWYYLPDGTKVYLPDCTSLKKVVT